MAAYKSQKGERNTRTKARKLERDKERVRAGRKARDEAWEDWEIVQRLYRSEFVTKYPTDSTISVNLIYAYVESMLPSLVFQDPVFTAKPLNNEADSARKTTEAAVTAELRSNDLQERLVRIVMDMLLKSCGVMQLGYYRGSLVPGDATRISSGQESGVEQPRRSSDRAYGFTNDSIYLHDIRPEEFLNDPMGCRSDLSDSTWVAVEYLRLTAKVKKDPQYKNTSNLMSNAVINTDSEGRQKDSMHGRRSGAHEMPEEDMEYVRIIQMWDIEDDEVRCFTMNHNSYICEDDWGDFPVKRFPFYCFHGTDDNGKFWRQSPVWTWVNLVDELNLVLSSRLQHIKRFVRKYLVAKGSMDEEDYEALEAPIDGAIVEINADNRPLNQVVQPLDDAKIPKDSYAFTAEIKDRWREQSGMSEMDSGAMRPGERPAAEVNRIAAGSNLRRQGTARRIVSPLRRMAGDAASVMRAYYKKPRVVEITGEKGEAVWLEYSGENLSTGYLWRCSIEDNEPQTRSGRLQKALQKLQILMPFGQGGLGMIDLVPVLKKVGSELGEDLTFLPESGVMPMDPGLEWMAIRDKNRDLKPHEMDDHMHHMAVHGNQIQEEIQKPVAEQSQGAFQRLLNHFEAHKAYLLAMQESQMGMQQQGQGGGAMSLGAPGQTPGQTQGGQPGPNNGLSNNPSGGGGMLAGNGPGADLAGMLGGDGGMQLAGGAGGYN